MTVKTNTTFVKTSFASEDVKTVTGFQPVSQAPQLSFAVGPNTATYNRVLVAYGTLNSNANVTIDLRSFTSQLGESVTASKLAGYMVKAVPSNTSALGGQLQVGPGASNAAVLFMGGTGPYFQAPTNTNGACFMAMSGSHEALNTTVRNLLISNPGTNAIAYSVYTIEGD